MRKTLQELMASLGCEKWPARWETFYNTVMDDVEQNGCVYATPAYYDYIGDTYHILFRYRDVYKTAAKEVSRVGSQSLLESRVGSPIIYKIGSRKSRLPIFLFSSIASLLLLNRLRHFSG